jgi:hypothetical protein
MAMETASVLSLVGDVLTKSIPALIGLIRDALNKGQTTAEELRRKPITVSIAFEGQDGEAIKVQEEIEALLPDEPEPEPGAGEPPQ